MVYVKLEHDWTDGTGGIHAAGAMVDVDVSTLARLEAQGLVAEPGVPETAVRRTWIAQSGGEDRGSGGDDGGGDGGGDGGDDDQESWIGPTGGDGDGGGGDPDSWIGPTGGGSDPDSWIGPTGGDGRD